jgi:hypothetical protein
MAKGVKCGRKPKLSNYQRHGHRSNENTVIYTSVADKRIRNIWGK